MLGIEVHTSKVGRLWPSEYWKTLIDALAIGGAKRRPHDQYRDLADSLSPLVQECDARFGPTVASPLADRDDVCLREIQVRRVPEGSERIRIGEATPTETAGWKALAIPYFGTIGDSKVEAQSRSNVASIEREWGELLRRNASSSFLSLCFVLSATRRDRDLDNVADAIAPPFGSRLPNLTAVRLMKESSAYANESIRISFSAF